MRYFPILLLISMMHYSCQMNVQDKTVIARVGEAELFEEDVLSAIPAGLDEEDSLQFLKGLVNRWTEEQVMYQLALENLPNEQPRIENEIEKYKRTLYVFTYENELLKSQLDTNVHQQEINEYFELHKNQFVLRQSILKYHLMVMGTETKQLDKLLKKFQNPSAEDLADLGKFCSKSAYKCDFEDNWSTLHEAKTQINPLERYLKSNNLEAGRMIKLVDSNLVYAIKINELKIREDIPPLDFVKDDIKEIIINNRKSILLHSIRNNIFTDAKNNNKIEVFLPENK